MPFLSILGTSMRSSNAWATSTGGAGGEAGHMTHRVMKVGFKPHTAAWQLPYTKAEKGLVGGGGVPSGIGEPAAIPPMAPGGKRMVRAEVCADQATAIMEFFTWASFSCSSRPIVHLRWSCLAFHVAASFLALARALSWSLEALVALEVAPCLSG